MAEDKLVRFHLSLNVADLGKSVQFYRALFDMEPAKLRPDYAKFEPDVPPLVLSLEPMSRPFGGPLNHLGLRLPNSAALVALQARMESNGLRSQREEGVECCYARQTKFWLHDPDGTLWEVYTLDGDIEHRGDGQAQEAVIACAPPQVARQEWEHRLGSELPARLPFADGSLDEVRLRGTLNMSLTEADRHGLFAEVARVLRPGGRLFVHVLTADREVTGPTLPGPAGAVRAVPPECQPVRLMEEAGLIDIRYLKLDSKPCFIREGVSMRETQVEGYRPSMAPPDGPLCDVLYRGPFEAIEAFGTIFRRGKRQVLPRRLAEGLRQPERAGQFTVFDRLPSSEKRPTIDENGCGTGR